MNPTKLSLHFSDFSVIFYAIYKKQQNSFTIGVVLLQERPWEDFWNCNVVPRVRWPARLAKFRRLAAVPGRGRGGGWLGAHHTPV
jgi:hypothetical protein